MIDGEGKRYVAHVAGTVERELATLRADSRDREPDRRGRGDSDSGARRMSSDSLSPLPIGL